MNDEMRGTLEMLVATIDDEDFDACDPVCIRDLVQYINIQCRALIAPANEAKSCES